MADFSESLSQNPCCYSATSTALQIDPDDLLSSKRSHVDESIASFKTLLLNEQWAHNEKLDSPLNPTSENIYSYRISVPNDSDQELEEDYSHQIECLKEEMLTDFPMKLHGILPLLDNSRHNSCIPATLKSDLGIQESPEQSEECISPQEKPNNKLENNSIICNEEKQLYDLSDEANIDKLVSELIDGVIKFANIVIKSDTMVESVIETARYTEIIFIVSEELVEKIIIDSINFLIQQNRCVNETDDDLSPVLEPASPIIEDCDYYPNYNDIIHTNISKETPKLTLSLQNDDANIGLILTSNGDDELAPLSPIIECVESIDKSPEIFTGQKSGSKNNENNHNTQIFCQFTDSNSSSLKEFEIIEDDLLDEQSDFIFMNKSPSIDGISQVKETAILDEVPDISETHSMTSTASSQQCSVIYTSQRAESLLQIDSDSAAGLAIDLLTSSSRTTSMSSSIMQMSCHSTDSTTLTTTTTTGSTLVRVSQPFDDLISLSENISPGCMSSG